jgi:hypothetical protein
MIVREVKRVADEFASRAARTPPLEIEFSRPWHFNESRQEYPPFRGCPGVYVYAQADSTSWNTSFDASAGEVWYIGMSEADLAGRIWAHVGPIYDPATRQEWTPRFRNHQWNNDTRVEQRIRDAIAEGRIVVYSIRVPREGQYPGWDGF